MPAWKLEIDVTRRLHVSEDPALSLTIGSVFITTASVISTMAVHPCCST